MRQSLSLSQRMPCELVIYFSRTSQTQPYLTATPKFITMIIILQTVPSKAGNTPNFVNSRPPIASTPTKNYKNHHQSSINKTPPTVAILLAGVTLDANFKFIDWMLLYMLDTTTYFRARHQDTRKNTYFEVWSIKRYRSTRTVDAFYLSVIQPNLKAA